MFHTPYYPQFNGMVERANGLLKRYLKPHKGQWDACLSKTLHQLNNRYGPYGSSVTQAFLTAPLDKPLDTGHIWPSMKPGQPVMVKLPSVGTVPTTLSHKEQQHRKQMTIVEQNIQSVLDGFILYHKRGNPFGLPH